MRTTVDIPDELFRQAKARAALEGMKLKELVAVYLAQGLARSPEPDITTSRQRSPLPIARAATGQSLPLLTNREIETILEQEEVQHVSSHRSS